MTYGSIEEFFAKAQQRPSSKMAKAAFEVHPVALQLPLLRAYVDETGDRGASPAASPVFGMASVLVTEEGERAARSALAKLRSDFGTPPGRPLSWKRDIKNHDRAVHAAETLAEVGGLMVVYVVAKKAALDAGTYKDDVTLFYNFMAYATLQRTLWAAANWPGGQRRVEIRFGHVAKHDPTDTHNYFRIKQSQVSNVPFWQMTHLSWVAATQFEMSQVADLYGGFLKAATWPNEFGRVEAGYLRRVWGQIRKVNGCPINLGFMYRPNDRLARESDWWPCACRRCVA